MTDPLYKALSGKAAAKPTLVSTSLPNEVSQNSRSCCFVKANLEKLDGRGVTGRCGHQRRSAVKVSHYQRAFQWHKQWGAMTDLAYREGL